MTPGEKRKQKDLDMLRRIALALGEDPEPEQLEETVKP